MFTLDNFQFMIFILSSFGRDGLKFSLIIHIENVKVSRYDSNKNNKKKINAKGNKCGDNAIWRVDYYKQNK